MNNREEIKQKLKQIKSLADRGVGGEKENASLLFKKLCEKYKISEEDFNNEREFWLNFGKEGEFKYSLSSLILVKVLGDVPVAIKKVGSITKVGFITTLEIFVDMKTTIELLIRHREEGVKLFDQAFIIKHGLATKTVNPSDLTEEQIESFSKIYKLMENIDKKDIHKEIEVSSANNS